MIKNKVLNIKIIFKIYCKQVKNILGFKTNFCFIKYHIIVFKNCFEKLFFRTIFKNSY